jgi:hypothetical protein
MQTEFDIAGGTIPGGDHLQRGNLLVGKNNQDAWCVYQHPRLTIAIVSDGCGSQARSEVGSNVGCQIMRTALLRQWTRHVGYVKTEGFEKALTMALEAARQDTLAHLRVLAQAIAGDGSFSQAVCDNFLFTLVGCIIAEQGAAFFTIGDGLIIVNGEVLRIGPFEGNEPPYLSYALLNTRWKDEQIRFAVHRIVPTAELSSFLVGSDGAADLAAACEFKLPGYDGLIGSIDQFWSNNQYFSKTGIRRRLALINSRFTCMKDGALSEENPRLKDDTTLIVGRRKGTEK